MYSGFWRRLGAWWLDAFIVVALSLTIGLLIPYVGGIAVWFFYGPILEASALRGTIGKYLMGIQVADLQGGRVTFQASLIRNAMKIVSGMILAFCYIMMLFTERKQALHDLVADTTVVYGRNDINLWDAWVAEIKEVFQGRPSMVIPPGPVAGSGSGFGVGGVGGFDVSEQLAKIQAMRDSGQLTQEEYEIAKRKILS